MVGGLLASGPLFDATPRRKPGRVTPPGVVKLPVTNPRGHAKDDPSDCTKHSVWRRTSLTSVGVDEDHSSGSSLPSLSRIEVSRMAPFPTSGRHTGAGKVAGCCQCHSARDRTLVRLWIHPSSRFVLMSARTSLTASASCAATLGPAGCGVRSPRARPCSRFVASTSSDSRPPPAAHCWLAATAVRSLLRFGCLRRRVERGVEPEQYIVMPAGLP